MSKIFNVVLSFLDPVEGNAVVEAADKAEATKMVLELFQNREKVNIINVFEIAKDLTDLEDQFSFPYDNNEKVIN